MAQVSLQINGFGHVLGCADGEEDHLRALAADLDRRIDAIKKTSGPISEARALLMAALMLADELHDIRGQASQQPKPAEPKAGKRLRTLAKKAETIADLADAASAPPAEPEENIAATEEPS